MGMLVNPYFKGQPLLLEDMWPTVDIPDVTDMVNNRVLLPIPADRIALIQFGIFGTPEAGKTQFSIHLAKLIFDHYGEENVNIIYGRNVSKCLPQMDAKPVQFIIIDDASGSQNSRKAYENVEATQEVFTARHSARERKDGTENADQGGIVFLVWICQVYATLDKNLRKFHYVFVKTFDQTESNVEYKRLIGGYADPLRKNTLKIEAGDQTAKGYCLCAIPSMFQDGNRLAGRGAYRSKFITDFPQFPDTRLIEKPAVKPVDDFFKDIDPEKLFKAREISYLLTKGLTQTEIGKQWDMTQPDVSKLLKWYHALGGVKDE